MLAPSNECKEGGEAMQEKELLQLIRKARSKDSDAFSSLVYFYMKDLYRDGHLNPHE